MLCINLNFIKSNKYMNNLIIYKIVITDYKNTGPMFVQEMSGERSECPLCLEDLEIDDLSFYPCPCGYQVAQY